MYEVSWDILETIEGGMVSTESGFSEFDNGEDARKWCRTMKSILESLDYDFVRTYSTYEEDINIEFCKSSRIEDMAYITLERMDL